MLIVFEQATKCPVCNRCMDVIITHQRIIKGVLNGENNIVVTYPKFRCCKQNALSILNKFNVGVSREDSYNAVFLVGKCDGKTSIISIKGEISCY